MDAICELMYMDLEPRQQLLTAVSCGLIDSIRKLLDSRVIDIDSKLQVCTCESHRCRV